MKALSLWQPWATLIALGVKQVETRSWSTKYRGPLAIHAAQRPIRAVEKLGPWEAWPADKPGRLHPNHDAERPARLYRNDVGIMAIGRWAPLPLGCVIATCRLVDCVSTDRISFGEADGWRDGRQRLVLLPPEEPLGDYSPGRYAWLLADIERLDSPVPVKGRQGMWEWDA